MALDQVLNGCELFFELYEDEIERILKSQRVHSYNPGDTIIKEQDKGDQIFVLMEGAAEVVKSFESGDRVVVEKIKAGEVFGLLLLLDEKGYGVDIVAQTRCAVLEIKHKTIMEQFDKNPRIFGIILLNISRILGKRLRQAHIRFHELKSKS